MTSKEIQEGNKLIWAFIGGKWQPTENAGKSGMTSYKPLHKTYEKCQETCNKINALKSGSPGLITYATPSPARNTIDRNFKYHLSWDSIISVVHVISKLTMIKSNVLQQTNLWENIIEAIMNLDITLTWKQVVIFIRWYNAQTSTPK